jgi:hypothetical protein
MLKQTYQQDEAEQILRESVRRAAEQEAAQATGTGTVSHERLVAMAEELGVSPDTLAAVLNDRAAEGAKEQARAAEQATEQQERRAFIVERQGDFYPHLWSYIGVNVMLIAINLMTSHGPNHLWAIYPMLGWGIGLFCHAMSALPTRGPTFEKEFAAWQTKRREKAEKLRRKAERERAAAAAAAASAQAKSARAKGRAPTTPARRAMPPPRRFGRWRARSRMRSAWRPTRSTTRCARCRANGPGPRVRRSAPSRRAHPGGPTTTTRTSKLERCPAYEVRVGMECHAELLTESKMFCACKNEFGGEPNTRTCPVCLGPARQPAGF